LNARPAIVWFRHDLRLADNAALSAAVASGAPIVPVFVFDALSPGAWAPGGASRWWLGKSLQALDRSLVEHGGRLIVRQGETLDVLARLAAETNASDIYCSRDYEPWSIGVEKVVHAAMAERGVALKRYRGRVLFEPDAVSTKEGQPYKVFTPYWRAVAKLGVGQPLDVPSNMRFADGIDGLDEAGAWERLTSEPKWAESLEEAWEPGEAGGRDRLRAFLENGLGEYATLRDRPDLPQTSRLSPYLHFGEVSPRQVWHGAQCQDERAERGREVFLKEIAWREFSYNLLYHWPKLPEAPLRREFEAFEWQEDEAGLEAWKRGQTGYPIVDAGMRQLWQTGWMHNRVRMIVASFLIKDLLLPWQEGEAWFWDTLVDADLASNAASWQWVAGCGADAAPYFRIYNPVKQGQKFDPEGDYVRTYVPELAGLASEYIHAPWQAPEDVLDKAGVKLGENYPGPIVDHQAARQRALALFEKIRSSKAH
jgi:deoxyribodipyrimidine photo-lyase